MTDQDLFLEAPDEQSELVDRILDAACLGCGAEDGSALWLRFSGGYGQFIDPTGGEGGGQWVALCGHCLLAAPAWVRSAWPWTPPGAGYMPLGDCHNCHRVLPLTVSDTRGGLHVETDNVLTVTRTWGSLGSLPAPHVLEPLQRTSVCHDCAHELCDEQAHFDVLLEPARGHAHTTEFWAANPHHEGWDRPDRHRGMSC